MATNRSKSAPKRETRTPITFETAVHLCPHQGVADNVAPGVDFGLSPDRARQVRRAYAFKRMAEAISGVLPS